MSPQEIDALLVTEHSTIADAMRRIDTGSKGIALVVDDDRRLVATLTDGDIRRGFLSGCTLETTLGELLRRRDEQRGPQHPITSATGMTHAEHLALMHKHAVRQLPVLDEAGRLADLVLQSDLVEEYEEPLEAIVMAGGKGTRLYPLTHDTPKPMLPVGGRPILERIIGQLRDAGISHVNLATHYQKEKISEHFGDGEGFGLKIEYVSEEQPLGTAGAVGLVKDSGKPLLVMNGDILTQTDFRAMHEFHREHRAQLTVAVRQYDLKVPYGVVETAGPHVRGLKEKPVLNFMVNAGIYLLEPSVRQFIPKDRPVDMTEVIESLLAAGQTVVSFPVVEYWLDIGRPDDYAQAQVDAAAPSES